MDKKFKTLALRSALDSEGRLQVSRALKIWIKIAHYTVHSIVFPL